MDKTILPLFQNQKKYTIIYFIIPRDSPSPLRKLSIKIEHNGIRDTNEEDMKTLDL